MSKKALNDEFSDYDGPTGLYVATGELRAPNRLEVRSIRGSAVVSNPVGGTSGKPLGDGDRGGVGVVPFDELTGRATCEARALPGPVQCGSMTGRAPARG
jgi:hypothetical protein